MVGNLSHGFLLLWVDNQAEAEMSLLAVKILGILLGSVHDSF